MCIQSTGLYIHIPYCRVACPYCDFVKRPTEGNVPSAFVDALCREIREAPGPEFIGTVFFGGGTPSLLTTEDLVRVFDAIRGRFEMANVSEIGMEVNPDDVTPEAARAWRDVGVNRITLGVQSFDDEALRYLGRCHDAYVARRACDMVVDTFDNWGLDLIFGALPHASWSGTLNEAIRLAPQHISTYGLTYEQGTPFWSQRSEAIADDTSLALYRETMDTLTTYNHYEVSNFALPGFESKHNQLYWRNDEYIGVGPGAYSYLNVVRARNAKNIPDYERQPGIKIEELRLTEDEIKLETVIQHFRTRAGLPNERYRERFGCEVADDFGAALDRLIERGLIAATGEGLAPTRKGYELNDEIGLELIPSNAPH